MRLRDPWVCPHGHRDVRIVDSRKRRGFRRQMFRCQECGRKWPAFLSLIDPRRAIPATRPSI